MKKVHVIGGGISGCSLAYFLSDRFDVTVYEKSSHLGGLCRTHETIENIPYQNGLHTLKNPEQWILDLISTFTPLKEVSIKFGINPFVDFNTYDFPLKFENISSIAWHWIETIKMELIATREEYTEEILSEFLIRNYGKTIYSIFYEGYYNKLYGLDASEIYFQKEFKSDFRSLNDKTNEKYFFPVDIGWNNLFLSFTRNCTVKLNQDIRLSDVSYDDIIINTVRPDLFIKNERFLNYRSAVFDIDSSIYKKDYYDVVLYPNYMPFISMSQFGNLFPKYEKNIIIKEYVSDSYEAEEAYIPLTRSNIFEYNVLIEKYQNIIFAGRFGSYKNLSMTDCIKQSASIAAKLKMDNA